MIEGELKKRIEQESFILDVYRAASGWYHIDQDELKKLFPEMEEDSNAKYPVLLSLKTIRLIEEAKKEYPMWDTKKEGYSIQAYPEYAKSKLHDRRERWFNKYFGELERE